MFLRGNLEYLGGQYAVAEATFQQSVDLERANTGGPTYALALGQLVEAQLAQGKLAAAVADADALLAMNAKNPIARYLKASIEFQQNDLDGAERRLESLVSEFPEYWPAHRMLGAINIRQNQPGQAVMYLRTALNNNPGDGVARTQLAEVYIREGDVEAAKKLMESAPSAAMSDGVFFAFAGRTSQRPGSKSKRRDISIGARGKHARTSGSSSKSQTSTWRPASSSVPYACCNPRRSTIRTASSSRTTYWRSSRSGRAICKRPVRARSV